MNSQGKLRPTITSLLSFVLLLNVAGCLRPTADPQSTADGQDAEQSRSESVESENTSAGSSVSGANSESTADCELCEAKARQVAAASPRPPVTMADRRADMSTIHAMFGDRDKIRRTVKNLPDGAEAITESDDENIVSLLQEHVPSMEGRVLGNQPLPPMTFHPIFTALIQHADEYTLDYEDTDKGISVRYRSENPHVVMLVQEHAKLVSRFLTNGMREIHTDYTLPTLKDADVDAATELSEQEAE